MRVFTFISKDGDGLPFAQRIVDEGHRVVFYINSKDRRKVGEGMIEKSPVEGELISKGGRINASVLSQVLHPKPDCIVFDMVGKGFGKLADQLRRDHFPVIGGSLWGDQIELDRPYGTKIMKLVGIDIPKTFTFTDYQVAIRFVEEKNRPYVYKPSGNQPTTTTYIAKGADDLIGVLEYYSGIKEEFELQERVNGIEISTELWFNGKEVINVNHTMEEKTLMDSGIGPKTGSMGSVVWVGSQDSRLYKEGIGKIIKVLGKTGYLGPIDLNTIVSKDQVYGLEFTPRFGYDAIFALLELYQGKLNDLLYGMATGVIKQMDFKPGWGIGVVFCLPPYPMPEAEDYSEDTLIQGISNEGLRHVWFYDVYKKGDQYACAGCGGNLGAATARSLENHRQDEHSIREAKRRVYRTISNLVIPDVMYRTDIGDRVIKDIDQLKTWRWL